MNITFNKAEILAALSAHVAATGITLRGKEVSLVGNDDIAIEVSIDEATTRKVRKTRTSKAKPAAESETTEEVVASEDEGSSEADAVADEMEGKTETASTKKRAPAKKRASTTKKKRMFGAAKK